MSGHYIEMRWACKASLRVGGFAAKLLQVICELDSPIGHLFDGYGEYHKIKHRLQHGLFLRQFRSGVKPFLLPGCALSSRLASFEKSAD
jgi:hypothetical protein